eukprot:Awhi_evm1s14185
MAKRIKLEIDDFEIIINNIKKEKHKPKVKPKPNNGLNFPGCLWKNIDFFNYHNYMAKIPFIEAPK